MKIPFRILSIVLTIFILLSCTAYAAQSDLSANDLLNEFKNDEVPIDSTEIINNVTLTTDGTDTLEGLKELIKTEPSNLDYYNKAAEFYSNSSEQDIKVFSDGNQIDFSKYDNVLPIIEGASGRTMVPARALTESMGATVDFDSTKNLITIVLGEKIITLTLNSSIAYVDDAKVIMDAPAKAINGRTMIPLRFVSQNCGKNVGWHTKGNAKVISIYEQ